MMKSLLAVLLLVFSTSVLADKTCEIRRDSHGRIQRSSSAIMKFKRMTGYPNGRPGYIIDHIRPLACGGCDEPANMQWQTIADAKAKDKWERKMCGGTV